MQHKKHLAPRGNHPEFKLSHALIWTVTIALTAYIAITGIRIWDFW